MPWLFLVAYTCSGFAGLVYEVTWTRLLTLHLGHTTAAASTVVGAFLLGLAGGAAAGGHVVRAMTRTRALRVYVGLELAVAAAALAIPVALAAFEPVLRWAYQDGDSGTLFPIVRVALALVLVMCPALALGATFACAIRWFAHDSANRARRSALLYATNTLGAAAGALMAGFVLIPTLGVRMTTLCAMSASVVSAGLAWLAGRRTSATDDARTEAGAVDGARIPPSKVKRGTRTAPPSRAAPDQPRLWLAAGVLGLSGFAALAHEIAWTRILALAIGPTTYAFAAALAAVITGTALGSWIGTWLLGGTRQPAFWLALSLAAAAATAAVTYGLAGRDVPLFVANQLTTEGAALDTWVLWSGWITAALVVPTALCLGVTFPLALAVAGADGDDVTERVGIVFAVNTVGAVTGSLAAGFVTIPSFGLRGTLQIACTCLVVAALAIVWCGGLRSRERAGAGVAAALAVATLVASPPWDRALLASGAYLYAPYAPAGVDLPSMLTAGSLLYYRDGAAATVSVKRLTGTTTLSVDGKTDASNRGDMLTQALVAHIPLLMHDAPRQVAIVGLGSGVTVGAALTHPVARVDVVELSPEVVEASRFFETENRRALADPRTRLIVGDGRTHLRLSDRRFDVIVSEPSNPWIAGVAALFTREFFEEASARLTPGGVFCQWANAYNIGDADLRAIVKTFQRVFPHATAFLVGEHDVLLVGTARGEGNDESDLTGAEPLTSIARSWTRPGVAEDLARYDVRSPFALLSLVVGGPAELLTYGRDARELDDDRMPLEFSAPREIHRQSGSANGATLRALLLDGGGPPAVRAALAAATAADWRDRGLMLARFDVHARAYDDLARALQMAPDDADALAGLVRSATLLKRASDALALLEGLNGRRPPSVDRMVATAKLHAASGNAERALATAREVVRLHPASSLGLEQIPSLVADTGDAAALATAVADLERAFPDRASTAFHRAVKAFLQDDAAAALAHAERAIARDPSYAPVYDLAGAALTKLDRPDDARAMFERSLTFDAHDSTAYANLGLLALAAGRRDEAASRFAEALWLDAESATARQGLARAVALRR